MTDSDQPDLRSQVDSLGHEVYGDDFETFLATPRVSLGGEAPAALIERGDLEPVRQILIDALEGNFG